METLRRVKWIRPQVVFILSSETAVCFEHFSGDFKATQTTSSASELAPEEAQGQPQCHFWRSQIRGRPLDACERNSFPGMLACWVHSSWSVSKGGDPWDDKRILGTGRA